MSFPIGTYTVAFVAGYVCRAFEEWRRDRVETKRFLSGQKLSARLSVRAAKKIIRHHCPPN